MADRATLTANGYIVPDLESPGVGYQDLPPLDLAGPGFRLDNTGVTSVSTAINEIFAAMVAGTRPVQPVLFRGVFRTTAPLVIDRSAIADDPINGVTPAIPLIGLGSGLSEIKSDHAGVCIDYRGGTGAGVHSFAEMRGLRLRGQNRAVGSIGIKADNLSYFAYRDLDIALFEYGIDGTDVLSGAIENSIIRLNKYGFRLQYTNSSYPNAISMRSVVTTANTVYGGYVIGGSTFAVHGGSFESNGTAATAGDATSWGLRCDEMGAEGGVGLSMNGAYIEGNTGFADIWLQQSLRIASSSIVGTTFNRISSTAHTTYQLYVNAPSLGAGSVCHLAGNGFKKFNTYVNSGARPHIAATPVAIANAGGNYFDNVIPYDTYAPLALPSAGVAFLPSATNRLGQIHAVSDGNAGAFCLAMSDGTAWKRIVLGATVAAI